MTIAIAFNHPGINLCERSLEELVELYHKPLDLGVHTDGARVDYPDNVRASVCHNTRAVHQGVEHYDTIVLCPPPRSLAPGSAESTVLCPARRRST